jgi:CYTH domain-containing protein
MRDAAAPKYSLLEIERRWLVDLTKVDVSGAPCRVIEDLYIDGTRLRLRKISDAHGEVSFKLGKKYGKHTPLSEPITNLYLTEGEHLALSALPGRRARKRRFALQRGSIDIYSEPHDVAVYEVEFEDEHAAREFVPPDFVTREITNEPAMSGLALSTAEE